MNKFYTDNFSISKIVACVCVKSGTGRPIHKNRQFHGIVMQTGGSKKYVFDSGIEITTYKNSVFYLPKFSNYEVLNIEEGDCIAINFDLYNEALTYEPVIQKPSHRLEKYFNDLLEKWTLGEQGYLNACMGDLYNIIFNMQKNEVDAYVPSSARKLVDEAIHYISANISDNSLTVQSTANYLGISTEYLRILFKKTYNLSPKQYIVDIRMKKAKELILSREFLISRVSQMCGYDNESYFSSEFKRIYGCSPSAYINEHI